LNLRLVTQTYREKKENADSIVAVRAGQQRTEACAYQSGRAPPSQDGNARHAYPSESGWFSRIPGEQGRQVEGYQGEGKLMRLTLNESEVIAILTALNVRAHALSQIITNTNPVDVTPDYLQKMQAKRAEISNLYTRLIKLR
jgi:hypothetical protein